MCVCDNGSMDRCTTDYSLVPNSEGSRWASWPLLLEGLAPPPCSAVAAVMAVCRYKLEVEPLNPVQYFKGRQSRMADYLGRYAAFYNYV